MKEKVLYEWDEVYGPCRVILVDGKAVSQYLALRDPDSDDWEDFITTSDISAELLRLAEENKKLTASLVDCMHMGNAGFPSTYEDENRILRDQLGELVEENKKLKARVGELEIQIETARLEAEP